MPDINIPHLHALYRRGTGPADIVERVYAAIGRVAEPGIFISMVSRADARRAAQALPPFDPVAMPLWGVPFAVKDNIDVAGMPTTAACKEFAYTPEKSATVRDTPKRAAIFVSSSVEPGSRRPCTMSSAIAWWISLALVDLLIATNPPGTFHFPASCRNPSVASRFGANTPAA